MVYEGHATRYDNIYLHRCSMSVKVTIDFESQSLLIEVK